MAFMLHAPFPGHEPTKEQQMNLDRARRGGATRAKQLNGFVEVQANKGVIRVRWRWRHYAHWTRGSCRTMEEAQAWAKLARAAIAEGNEPPAVPRFYLAPVKQEVEAKNAEEDAAPLKGEPERCPLCKLLRPCDPCLPELRAMARGARRGVE